MLYKYNPWNPILNTDSYKYSHYLQLDPNVRLLSAYIEPRWGKSESVVFFGPQMFLKEYLSRRIIAEDVNEAEAFLAKQIPSLKFNRPGFDRIVSKHGGYWPLRIQAIPEGTVHDHRITQLQVSNTDPELPWVTTFTEALLRATWYPTNVATRSYQAKKILRKWMLKTCDTLDGLPFKLHDFGSRGASSNESSGIGGAAHLVNFMGTDTVMGAVYAANYYGADMAGFSIPAAEHSTITSWGEGEFHAGEIAAYRNMINQFGGKGNIFAVVLDSYDVYNALENLIGGVLKNEVENNGATIAVRLDSGNPVTEPARALEILGAKFGYSVNSKGYKVLPQYIRIVQGDGVNLEMLEKCCAELARLAWSLDNIGTFGMGGELLQKHDRDTHGYAFKANAKDEGTDDGWIDVSKNPVGAPEKKSKAGRRAVREFGTPPHIWYEDDAINSLPNTYFHDNILNDVWVNGDLKVDWSFKQIQDRVARTLV